MRWIFAHTKIILVLVVVMLSASGCSLLEIRQDKRAFRTERNLPQRPELPFENKEQLSRATALNLDNAEKVYFEGCEPKSEPADILLKLSKKFISTLGINTDFDPNDPESVESVFKGVNEANRKIREQNAQLREKVKEANAEKAKIIRDKAAEMAAMESGWKAKLGSLWWWIWVLVIALIALCIFFPAVGIPVAKFIMSKVYGVAVWAGKRTFNGLQEFKDTVEDEIKEFKKKETENGGLSDEDKTKLVEKEQLIERLKTTLHKHQHEEDKDLIKKLKAKGEIRAKKYQEDDV